MIRAAQRQDVERMLEIYAPYVRETAISLEFDPPTLEVFLARFERVTRRFPWLVWEEDGRVLGYAYADVALERAAYQWDADMSVYVDRDARRGGVGSALYDCLEALMRKLGYRNLYALVTSANEPSKRFHEKRGYSLLGVLAKSGYKFDRWWDVSWYGLRLGGDEAPEGSPKVFHPDMLQGWQ